MKPMTTRLSSFFITVMITALLLVGAVPSFGDGWAWAAEAGTEAEEIQPAITIDKKDLPKVHGKSAIVMDADTGTVLFEKKADKVREPASVTKVLTLLVALENLELDQEVTVPDDVETSGSVIWLEPGEKIKVEDLLYGMMLESGNDAAQVLGLAASGGDLDKFSKMMNERARECGATHTDFKNPNGLNEDPDHPNYTTARDLALIAREGMNNPVYREVVSTVKHVIPKTNKSDKRTLYNTNACLWKEVYTQVNGKDVPLKFEGCNGIKTGFTSTAGFCYVGCAKQGKSEFIVVTLGAEDSLYRFHDALMLWDYAFSKYETYPVMAKGYTAGLQRVWAGKTKTVEVGPRRDLAVTIDKGTGGQQTFETEMQLDRSRVDAPIGVGQRLGKAMVYNDQHQLVAVTDLYALSAVAEGGPLSHIGIADEDLPQFFAIVAGVVFLLIILFFIQRYRRRRAREQQRTAMRGELATMRTAGTGMTARELTDVTGIEEYLPIRRGPERVSDEELTAWSSTGKRPKQSKQKKTGREDKAGGRLRGIRSRRAGADKGASSAARSSGASGVPGAPNAAKAPQVHITPRTPLTSDLSRPRPTTGAQSGTGASRPSGASSSRTGYEPRAGRHSQGRPMTDEEIFNMLDSTEVYDANQPRRHGKLTRDEMDQVMGTPKTDISTARKDFESSRKSRTRRRRRRRK